MLARLAGDVASLCAAACVAPAWRDAAAEPRLWARLALRRDAWAAVTRLTDARLATLVARSRGLLESLDFRGARHLTDKGFFRALQQPHALTAFSAEFCCGALTARGVARALASRRGRMRELNVRGMNCGPPIPEDDDTSDSEALRDAWRAACDDIINALRALMAPDGVLDGDRLCSGDGWRYELCPALCSRGDVCAGCDQAFCADHQTFTFCIECRQPFCRDNCLQSAACDSCIALNHQYDD